MIFELIFLALAGTVRPTSLAAVGAILAAGAPRRLLTAYVVAGIAFTVAVGLIVLGAFDGVDLHTGTSRGKGVAEIAGGVVALAFGLLLLSGRVLAPRAGDAPRTPGRWLAMLDRHLTLRAAALAGPATHIPGLFYLIALNLIAADQAGVPRAVGQLLVFNALWFALPLAALAICVADPATARHAIGAIEAWARRHARVILMAIAFAVGAVLVLRGALRV
jgi:Sap-like sulfolipid-1-addressing protein